MADRLRIWPRSLVGQTLAVLALALLIAQGVSAALLYGAAQERRETALVNAAAFQLVSGQRASDPRRIARREARRARMDGPVRRFPRELRYRETAASPLIAGETRNTPREEAIAELLINSGIRADAIVVTERTIAGDPLLRAASERRPRLQARLAQHPQKVMVVGLKCEGAATWQVVRIPVPQRMNWAVGGLAIQTVLLSAILLTLLWLALRRITRPLAALTQRTDRFSRRAIAATPLPEDGPDDIRRLIAAHNAMETRIAGLLEEKDVMLGAIGHDLKTPLAALRVRVESVENPAQRERMAATIEDIATTLDEILDLARVGKDTDTPEPVELRALVASVVEEFEDMGEEVTLASGERVVAPVHLTWLKRGLRNLVSNALRYGTNATVRLAKRDGCAIIAVEDEGPGIPEDRIAAMLEPFARGEASRNRATGGSGLGLTIARAVAERHGGTLVLTNRPQGGLSAEIRLPDSARE